MKTTSHEIKYTKTPWETDFTGTNIYESKLSRIGHRNRRIAVMDEGDTDTLQANAAFIVRAVNAYFIIEDLAKLPIQEHDGFDTFNSKINELIVSARISRGTHE